MLPLVLNQILPSLSLSPPVLFPCLNTKNEKKKGGCAAYSLSNSLQGEVRLMEANRRLQEDNRVIGRSETVAQWRLALDFLLIYWSFISSGTAM